MELTKDQRKELIREVISEYNDLHPCRFSESERHLIHSLQEITVEEKANAGTWRIIIQWGVNLRDVTKKVRTTIILLLGTFLIALGAKAMKIW